MTSIALDYIRAAQQALEEGASQTAQFLMEAATKQLELRADVASTVVVVPPAAVAVDEVVTTTPEVNASCTAQPNSTGQPRSVESWMELIKTWAMDLPHERSSFTHYQFCKCVEDSRKWLLAEKDLQPSRKENRPIWKCHVSKALRKLKEERFLTTYSGAGDTARKSIYRVKAQ